MTESLSVNQLPAKIAPSIAIVKDLDEQVKADIQNKVCFFFLSSYDDFLTHFTQNIQPSTLNLAPQKPDADLKRDVEKKLRKLARRTQRAIRELIRTYNHTFPSCPELSLSNTHTHTYIHTTITEKKLEAEQNGEFDGITGDAAYQLD